MTEMDQDGGIRPSHSDDGSEKQQQSSYSDESEDIASLQNKCPSFNQASPHALETLSSKSKAENVPENVNNGKGALESAGSLLSSDEAANRQNYGQATQMHESGGSSGKKRHSRWNSTPEEGLVTNEGECSGKKKKSRWATEEPKISMLGQTKLPDVMELSGKKKKSRWDTEEPKMSMLGQSKLPDFMKELSGLDPEVQELNLKLYMINWRLRTGNVIVASSNGKRSPSPDPIYNNLGMRINTREVRAREKLIWERDMTNASLNAKNPALKLPADSKKTVIVELHKEKPDKKKPHKKIYVPVKEYPGYNFIGLIIGPRGNNLKRMEQETGAKILLRGRGSRKEGPGKKDLKPEPSDYEDLHVLVEADDETALEKACTMVEKLLVPVEEGSNELKRAQLLELAKIRGIAKIYICGFCGQEGHVLAGCPVRKKSLDKVSSQGTKVDITNDHDLCFELGTGKLAASMGRSGSGFPRQSIQPQGPTGNYMSSLDQAGGLEHPQNGNARIGPEVMRVSTEKRVSEVPIQSSQPIGFTDSYMAWLAGGLEHPESVNPGIVSGKVFVEKSEVSVEKSVSGFPRQSTQPLGLTDNYMTWLSGGLERPEKVNTGVGPEIRKVSIEKSGSGLPWQSTQSLGLTDNYTSWLTGGLQHPESGKDGRAPEINKVSLEKSGSGIPGQSTQPLGPRDNYLSWLAGGLEHAENGSSGIGPDISKGREFGTSSVQGSHLHGYSPNFSHVGLESSFGSPSVSHLGLGPRFEHNHGKEIDHSNVYVGYLPPTMEEEQLIKLFSPFGRIVEAKVIRDDVKGSSKGYGFVKFYNIHCAAQAIAHMNGYRLDDKTLAVRVAGWPPGSEMGPAEDLYTFDKKQPPKLPVHSGDYAQISWNSSTRPVSLSPYNLYSNNNGSGMPYHSVNPLQGGTFNSLPATSYRTHDLYEMPLRLAESSSGMHGLPRSQPVLGNVSDSSMSKLNVHSADAMSHFSPNKSRISTYQHYAPPSVPSGSAYSELSSQASLMRGLGTTPRPSNLFPSGYVKKAMELEYERFLSETGP